MSSSLRQTFAMLVTTAVVLAVCVSSLKPEPRPALAVTWLDLSAALDRPDNDTPMTVVTEGIEEIVGRARVEGRVKTSLGEPADDATVTVARNDVVELSTGVDDEGRFVISGIEPGDIDLRVASPTAGSIEGAHLAEADTTFRWNPVIDVSRRVLGQVIDLRHGTSRAASEVALTLRDSLSAETVITTQRDGKFAWTAPTDDPIAVDLSDALGNATLLASTDLNAVAPGAEPFTIAIISGSAATVSGSVSIQGRDPLRPVTLIVRHIASGFTRRVSSAGYFTVSDLPPGLCALDIEAFGKLVHQSEPLELDAGSTLFCGDIAVEALGTLAITSSEDAEGWTDVRLEGQTGRVVGRHAIADAKQIMIAPGRYTLIASKRGGRSWNATVDVTSEETTTVAID